MAGTMIEQLSGRKLTSLCVALLLALLICFLVSAIVAPEPNSSQSVLGTICVDRHHEPQHWFQVWDVKGGQRDVYDKAESVESLMGTGISSEQVVFAFQLPLRKDRYLDFTRWQQNLIGVLQLDIDNDDKYEMLHDATLELNVRLGYKNKGDKTHEWTLLAASVEERRLRCELDPEHAYRYYCDLLPLFELDSLHHDFYLLNLRLTNMANQRNVGIGKLVDVNLVAIFQNGGFTKVWLSMKTVFLPLVVALLVWFWRRVRTLKHEPALIERMLFALGICLSVLNLPLEYLTLRFDMPYMPLITDIRQDVFYGALLSFWLVMAGEEFTIRHGSRLSAYWKELCVVAFGCISLVIFDTIEHGVQLKNPFHSIWAAPDVTSDIALGFVIYISVLAGLYLCYLSWMILRMLCIAKRRPIPTISGTNNLESHVSSVYDFKILISVSLVTLTCAALTVTVFILSELTEGQWKWDADIYLNYTSTLLTGVLGMWNLYTVAALFLYAPPDSSRPSAKACSSENTEALIDNDQVIHSDQVAQSWIM